MLKQEFCLENRPPNSRNKGELTDVKSSDKGECLSLFKLLWQNHRLGGNKQQEFLSHTSGDWEVQDHGACVVG